MSSAVASTPSGIATARCAGARGAPGSGKSTMKRSRRRNASSRSSLRVGGQDRDALEALHALQQVVDLEVGVAVVRVLHLGALAEERVGLVEEQDQRRRPRHASKTRRRFFSVSPMYLLTTCERSIAVERQAELGGQHLGGHRLAGAAAARRTAPRARLRSTPARCPTRSGPRARDAIARRISSNCSACLAGSTSSSRRKRGRISSASSPRSSSNSARQAPTSSSCVSAPFCVTRRHTARIGACLEAEAARDVAERRLQRGAAVAELDAATTRGGARRRAAGRARPAGAARRHFARPCPPPPPGTAGSRSRGWGAAADARPAPSPRRRGRGTGHAAQPAVAGQRLEQPGSCRAPSGDPS